MICNGLQKCELVLTYCLSDIDGSNEAHFGRLTALPLIAMADDSFATLTNLEDATSELSSLYVMRAQEAAALSALSHRIIKWTVSPSQFTTEQQNCLLLKRYLQSCQA